jgi:hypothetical protein
MLHPCATSPRCPARLLAPARLRPDGMLSVGTAWAPQPSATPLGERLRALAHERLTVSAVFYERQAPL